MIWPTFKDWFDLYDKRRALGECETEWDKFNQATHEIIYRHTEAYVIAQPDKLYRKDPIRYLKKKAWHDEIVIAKTPQKDITNGQYAEQVARAASERYARREAGNS